MADSQKTNLVTFADNLHIQVSGNIYVKIYNSKSVELKVSLMQSLRKIEQAHKARDLKFLNI
jgi:hypothetical protein